MYKLIRYIIILSILLTIGCGQDQSVISTIQRNGISVVLSDSARVEYIMPISTPTLAERLGIYKSKKWPADKRNIRVKWADGDAVLQGLTIGDWRAGITAKTGITFEVVTDLPDVIVSFTPNNQAWSYLGTDCKYIAGTGRITMNLGWHSAERNNAAERFGTGCHEMMHALGYTHTLQSPACASQLVWNKEYTYAYYARIGWDRAMVDQQVFTLYTTGEVDDPHCDFNSIMCYQLYPGMANITNQRNHYFTAWDDEKLIADYKSGDIVKPPTVDTTTTVSGQIISIGKPATQSSTWTGYPASLACDGITRADNFNHTNWELTPWWQVDLSGTYKVSHIKIAARSGCPGCAGRMRNIKVWVSALPVATYDTPGHIYMMTGYLQPDMVVDIDVPNVSGRYVRIASQGIGSNTNIIHLSEVSVYAGGTVDPPIVPVCKDTTYRVISYRDSVGRVCR